MNTYLKCAVALLAVCGTFFSSTEVRADCSVSDKTALLSCASNSVLACRNLLPTCVEPGQVITVQDVLSETTTKCCAITGKKKVARQRLCIATVELRYARSQVGADKTLKGFLRETKRQLSALKKAGCSTGSN